MKLLKLLKHSLSFKVNVLRSRLFYHKDSEVYSLAKYYQETLNTLNEDPDEIKSLLIKTYQLKEKFYDKNEIVDLLNSVLTFLEFIKTK
jgi:hypothetical protein